MEKDFTNLCPGSQVRKRDRVSKTKGTLWAEPWSVTDHGVSKEQALYFVLWAECRCMLESRVVRRGHYFLNRGT